MKRFLTQADPWKLCLFVLSIAFYLFFYADILLAPNTLLIADIGDSTKNYYTYMYQAVHGQSLTNFSGLNYPYGEHVVFTDGQPLLTFLLYIMPFLGGYAMGIMNFLVMASFIVMPLVIYNLARRLDLPQFMAFAAAFSVTVLSPQIFRLTGHFSLAYAFIFPLLLLKLVSYFQSPRRRYIVHLFLLNFAVFWLHPYTGFAFTFFTILSLLVARAGVLRTVPLKTFVLHFAAAAIIPIVLFKLLMLLTDQHGMRYDTPYGYNEYNAHPGSILVPHMGPFAHFMGSIIKPGIQDFERLAYIGICTFFTFIVFILLKIVFFKRFTFPRLFFPLFIPALFLLALSFGLHLKLGEGFTGMLGPIKQFRALGRFAWLFYYTSAILCFVLLYRIIVFFAPGRPRPAAIIFSLLFMGIFIIEAIPFHQFVSENTGFARNRFRIENLDENEKALVKELDPAKYQAIITLPFFHIGSEYFSREPASYIDAMAYSYQSGLPLAGNVGSRTAMEETKNALRVLNLFTDKEKFLAACKSKKDFAVLALGDINLYDEQEFLKKCTLVKDFGFARLYSISPGGIRRNPLIEKYTAGTSWPANTMLCPDSSKYVFKNTWDANGQQNNFVSGTPAGYTILCEIAPGALPPGEYVFSCHYFYDGVAERINNNLIVEEMINGKGEWPIVVNTRSQSGIFDDYIVPEIIFRISDDTTASYKLMYNGYNSDAVFKVSDVMIRPRNSDVLQTDAAGKVTGINNHPISAAK